MSTKAVHKAKLLMTFHQLLNVMTLRSEEAEKNLNMEQQMGEFENSIDAQTFVSRVLDGMEEMGKADEHISRVREMFRSEEKMNALIQSVQGVVKENTGRRLDLDESFEELMGELYHARTKFEHAGGHLLTNNISRTVLESFRKLTSPDLGHQFAHAYEQVLKPGGVFEQAVRDAGMQEQVIVARYSNVFPEVAMTPQAENKAVELLSNALWKEIKEELPHTVTEEKMHDLVSEGVYAQNMAVMAHRFLPLSDIYLDLRNTSLKEAQDKLDDFRWNRKEQRSPENDSELTR
jgi:hypothetical protein